MKNLVLKAVKDFLAAHWKKEGPVLVALSGGVDSSALFTLLLECRHFFALDLRVVHFDHAWRDESEQEAVFLRKWVESFGLSFYSVRSSKAGLEGGNLEEKARIERYAFFQDVYKQLEAQALLIGHQRDDQVETVLKRLFEGAGLFSLSGIRKVSLFNQMVVWRPLLNIPREDLEQWNQNKEWIPFKDRTNFDLKFLRPRMREEILPELERHFGKKVRQNLFRVGEEVDALRNSIMKKLESYLEWIIEGSWGCAFPVMEFQDLDFFEKQELVRLFLSRKAIVVSSFTLKNLISLLESNVSNKKVEVSKGVLLVERGLLIWMKEIMPSFEGKFCFETSSSIIRQGKWEWNVSETLLEDPSKIPYSLSSFLNGTVLYPIQDIIGVELCSYNCLVEKDQKKISGYLSKNKVPATLKKLFPFVIKNGVLVDLFFSNQNDLKCKLPVVFSNIILKM